jgi:hypothetical protein
MYKIYYFSKVLDIVSESMYQIYYVLKVFDLVI